MYNLCSVYGGDVAEGHIRHSFLYVFFFLMVKNLAICADSW